MSFASFIISLLMVRASVPKDQCFGVMAEPVPPYVAKIFSRVSYSAGPGRSRA